MMPIIINRTEAPIGALIFLHGLGADGFNLKDIFARPQFNKIRFILPHAPYQPVTINQGFEMRAWYDLYDLSLKKDEDELGMERSSLIIQKLIEEQISLGIPSEKIIIGGFSQGAAMSFYLGLKYHKKLGGIAALSGYLPLKEKLTDPIKNELINMPIFMAHGTYDPVVVLERAQASYVALEKMGYSVDWNEYPMEHSVNHEELMDISRFLQQVLKTT